MCWFLWNLLLKTQADGALASVQTPQLGQASPAASASSLVLARPPCPTGTPLREGWQSPLSSLWACCSENPLISSENKVSGGWVVPGRTWAGGTSATASGWVDGVWPCSGSGTAQGQGCPGGLWGCQESDAARAAVVQNKCIPTMSLVAWGTGMLQKPPVGTATAPGPQQPRISKRQEIADNVSHFPKAAAGTNP